MRMKRRMKKKTGTFAICLLGILTFATGLCSVAQNVGINATGAVPDASAMLDIASSTKGLLIPRVSLSATNSNAPVGAGATISLLVYNIAYSGVAPYHVEPGYYYWDGSAWVALGLKSLSWNITGNTGTTDGTHFIGTADNVPLNFRVNNQKAGRIDRTGQNTFFGYTAGNANTSASGNCAYGDSALYANNANSNTAVGKSALHKNSNGNSNTAIGQYALYNNTSASQNIAIGFSALYSNTSGNNNTGCGARVLFKNTTGIYNTAFGWNNMYNNTTGSFNTSLGTSILSANSTGSYNTALGFFVLTNSTGQANTAVGSYALKLNTTGNLNSALGDSALATVTTGSNNTGIGYKAYVPLAAGSNQVRVGNTSITYAGVQVAWSVTSDARWKKNIQTSDLGLNFVRGLHPVRYKRANDNSQKTEYGFIAQEVETLLNASGVTDSGIISKDDEGMLSMRYNDLLAPIIKAIQEQQALIETLKQKNDELEQRLRQHEKTNHH